MDSSSIKEAMACRSGEDRRFSLSDATEKRNGEERRHLLKNPVAYIEILEKIPIFKHLTVDQLNKLLPICAKKEYHKNEIVCREGDESLRLFILIKGTLKVIFHDGREFSKIHPLGLVGEMGVFTRQPRSATVISEGDAITLTIHSAELYKVFRLDGNLGIQVLMNVIQDLAGKLRKDNILIEELKQICSPEEFSVLLSKAISEYEK